MDLSVASDFIFEYNQWGRRFNNRLVEPAVQPPLTSHIASVGYIVLRNAFDTERESYFLLNATQIPNPGHQHADRGSFSLYAFNTPLAIDYGVHDYAVTRGEWYSRSHAHNMVQFGNRESVQPARIAHHLFDEQFDYVDVDLSRPAGHDYHRHVFFLKPHGYLIWDDIQSEESARYHLHVLASEVSQTSKSIQNGSTADIVFRCQNDVDLECHILSPQAATLDQPLEVRDAPHPIRFWAQKNSMPAVVHTVTPKWLQIEQHRPGQDFLTFLYPRRPDSSSIEFVELQQSEGEVSAAELRIGGERIRFVFGRAGRNAEILDGAAAIIRKADNSNRTEAYLIDGKRLVVEQGFEISVNHPTSLVVRTRDVGQVYEITNFGDGFERVELKLPWTGDLDKVKVSSNESAATPVTINATRGTFSFVLYEDHYRVELAD